MCTVLCWEAADRRRREKQREGMGGGINGDPLHEPGSMAPRCGGERERTRVCGEKTSFLFCLASTETSMNTCAKVLQTE